jgi:hypothetical protein
MKHLVCRRRAHFQRWDGLQPMREWPDDCWERGLLSSGAAFTAASCACTEQAPWTTFFFRVRSADSILSIHCSRSEVSIVCAPVFPVSQSVVQTAYLQDSPLERRLPCASTQTRPMPRGAFLRERGEKARTFEPTVFVSRFTAALRSARRAHPRPACALLLVCRHEPQA